MSADLLLHRRQRLRIPGDRPERHRRQSVSFDISGASTELGHHLWTSVIEAIVVRVQRSCCRTRQGHGSIVVTD